MKKILVIEDNEIIQELIVRRLKKSGFLVDLATDGEMGLKMVADSLPDLILLDMNLPKIDGWIVAAECKKNSNLQKIPIIAMTAHNKVKDQKKALDSGCDEYIAKPVTHEELLKKISLFLK